MTHTNLFRSILVIGLLSLLFAAGASAAAVYEFDTTGLIQKGSELYAPAGQALLLPVNLSCDGGNSELISRIEATVTVKQNNAPVTGLTYNYTSPQNGLKGQKVNEPQTFAMTDMGTGSSGINHAEPVFVLNITGLPASETSYNVNISFASGSGIADSVMSYKDIDINVRNWLELDGDVYNNTKESYAAADKWSFENNAEIRYEKVLMLPNPSVTGDYYSSLSFPKITRNETNSNYPYTVVFNNVPANATIIVKKSDDGNTWSASSAVVSEASDKTIKITLDTSDAGAKYLKLTFTGKKLGDVVDIDGTDVVNLADVDLLKQEIVSALDGSKVAKIRYIYGDIDGSGDLNSNDVLLIFQSMYE